MRVLISAYTCETGRGSEGEIGWRLVHELAKRHDVHVIVRANLRPVHEAELLKSPRPERLSFEYFDLPWIFRFYKKGKRFFLIYYYLWQIGVGLKAWQLQRQKEYDVFHHLIGGMDWMPAGLAFCPGPFVWGPVGSEDTHPIILRHLSRRSRMKEKLRVALRFLLRTCDPFTRFTAFRADIVLSHTPENLPTRLGSKVRFATQTGIADHPSLARAKADLSRGAVLRLLYAGELKDWKGARMALDAALRYFETDPNAELEIIGDGPLRDDMLAVAGANPHGDRVHFRGRTSMPQLVDALHEADVFLYPSFHHGLATVVLQAMLTGLPIICIEGDATGRAVRQEAGITVNLSKERDPADDIAAAIKALASDEPRRQALAMASRRIALDRYSYARLCQQTEDIYKKLI
ncbi:glycosyltransferase family 4 protein [Kordiimonas sp.]|uniref:glycosyltransferase family 4 protein n=1 Tax=Kordiimonas sp. TaxID=1970157 RepID=UPI003A95AECB